MKKERTRLIIDLDALLPGDEFLIGSQSITIRPLSITQYKLIVGKIKSLVSYAQEKGINGENYKDTEKFLELAEIILEKFPELLEEVSNIALEDLQELPLETIVSLLDKCLDVNLKAKESLMGNFKSLTTKMDQLGMNDKMSA